MKQHVLCKFSLMLKAGVEKQQGNNSTQLGQLLQPLYNGQKQLYCILALLHWEMTWSAVSAPSEMKLSSKLQLWSGLNPGPDGDGQLLKA